MNLDFIIAGPCLIESYELVDEVAKELKKISDEKNIKIFLKGSYRKANRTSATSFVGIGDELALDILSSVGRKYDMPCLTDIHTKEDAKLVAQYVDAIQIPAFLSRQTDLLIAAGETGKFVNIKKAQFMSPYDMEKAARKVTQTGNVNLWLTERGTFFGYNNLVVDFRSLIIMKQFGFPVIYDATHSLQQPSIGEQSGGNPEFIPAMARAATAIGINGIFFETHTNPKLAKSDAATQLPLFMAKHFVNDILNLSSLEWTTY
jgi:2-dehydro-3-deoxyphosphooctonate aldolase (KDO 8-P synthase)